MPAPTPPWGRLDDVLTGHAQLFTDPFRIVEATSPAQVAGVIEEVDRATSEGCWAVGFVAYEAAPGLDPRWTVARTDRGPAAGPPLAWFALCPDAPTAAPVSPLPGRDRDYRVEGWQRGWSEPGYRSSVARVRAAIADGETYQCNLTVRLRSRVTGDLEQLYADLVWAQRGHYGAYLDTGRQVVVSASPELFFEWAGEGLLTRPMKGTTARGRTTVEDDQQVRRLAGSPKERAENVMIVDLLRNDLGALAEVGSVQLPALFTPERYETLWQLTSDVTARVAPGTRLLDVFRALFPSGSVTGAPKGRTMQLLAKLEAEERGVYCGAIGVVAPPGQPFRARFSVAIRTVVVDRPTGQAVYGTGSGITWTSDPVSEHAELLTKSRILVEPYEDFALFETMAHLPGTGLRGLTRHLARLTDSAAYFGFSFDRQQAEDLLAAAVRPAARARVKLTLQRGGQLAVSTGPLPPAAIAPVRLAVDLDPVDASSRWLFHKTTRREVYTIRAARHGDADDVILVNADGEVTETTIANLAVRLDGRWWTPPAEAGCLPGVERGRLLASGRLAERKLGVADLRSCTGLAVLSSLRGWRTAVLLDTPSE